MIIIEDKAQQEGKHLLKHQYWDKYGVEYRRYPLPVGDYIMMSEKVEDVIRRKEARGIEVKKMDFVGTYNVCIDTKKDIQELCADICGPQHDRFRDEAILAQNNGIKLIILVENKSELIKGTSNIYNPYIGSLEELHKWKNDRLFIMKGGKQMYPNATKGVTLMKAAMTMRKKYGVDFLFCTPVAAGKAIVDILGNSSESHC